MISKGLFPREASMDVSDAEILVTGGAGFIGSNLIDSLLGKGECDLP